MLSDLKRAKLQELEEAYLVARFRGQESEAQFWNRRRLKMRLMERRGWILLALPLMTLVFLFLYPKERSLNGKEKVMTCRELKQSSLMQPGVTARKLQIGLSVFSEWSLCPGNGMFSTVSLPWMPKGSSSSTLAGRSVEAIMQLRSGVGSFRSSLPSRSRNELSQGGRFCGSLASQ